MGIRVETLADVTDQVVEAFCRLLPQLSQHAEVLDEAGIRRLISCETNTVLLAYRGDEIVGMLTLVVFPIPTGLRARLEDVVVDSAARGAGVGAALSAEAIRLAKQAGVRTIDLTSRPSREAANRLYRRLGFTLRDSHVYRYSDEG